MANEIQLTVRGVLNNGNLIDRFDPGAINITQTTKGGHSPVVSVGTSEEDLSFGDIGTVGLVFLRNIDATNFVTYGPKSAGSMVAFGKIMPGGVAVIQLAGSVTWRWIADTGAVKVQVRAWEA